MKWAPAKAAFGAWARRRSDLKRRQTLEFVQPWVIRMKMESLKRAKELQKDIAVQLNATYSQILDAVAASVADDVNGHTKPTIIDCPNVEDGQREQDANQSVAQNVACGRAPAEVVHNKMKLRYAAIRALSTVKSATQGFLKDMHGEPTTNQRQEDEAIAEFFTSSYGSVPTQFQDVVAEERQQF